MRANQWIYHYYTVQTKLQYGLAYPEAAAMAAAAAQGSSSTAAAAARLAAAAYFPSSSPSTHQLMNYTAYSHSPHHQMGTPLTDSGGSSTAVVSSTPSATYGTHSPHPIGTNGASPPSYYHAHHHHPYELAAAIGKDSPIDFSMNTSTPIPFDWQHHHHHSHHHQHLHPYSFVPSAASSPYHWSHHGANSVGGHAHHQTSSHNTSAQQGYTHAQHHSHSGSSHVGGQQRLQNAQGSPQSNSWGVGGTTTTASPASSNGSNSNSSVRALKRKRPKKVDVSNIIENGSSSPPINNPPSMRGSSELCVANPSSYHHHSRHRSYYKMSVGEELTPEHTPPIKEEVVGHGVMAMVCPLTPSPIWDSQTQRVPDLYYSANYGETSSSNGSVISALSGSSGSTTAIHCVPTYQPYLTSFNGGQTGGSMGVGNSPAAPGFGFSMGFYGSGAPTGYSMHVVDSGGSPNKENRLPPTPESEHGGEKIIFVRLHNLLVSLDRDY